MRTKAFFLLAVIFALVLPFAFAGVPTYDQLVNKTIIRWLPSYNISVDNSSYARTAVNNGGAFYVTNIKKVGEASGYFDGSQAVAMKYINDGTLSTTLNFTVSIWTNITDKNNIQHFVTRRIGTGSNNPGDWYFNVQLQNPTHQYSFGYWEVTGDPGLNCAYSVAEASDPIAGNHWKLLSMTINNTGGTVYGYLLHNKTVIAECSVAMAVPASSNVDFQFGGCGTNCGDTGQALTSGMDTVLLINYTLSSDNISNLIWKNGLGGEFNPTSPADAGTFPEITSYNMTSEGGEGCSNWNTDKNNACLTSDTTPTVAIKTSADANCRIGILNLNYTQLTNSRNCIGTDTTIHTCTLNSSDTLTEETSYLYVGCVDGTARENLTSTSQGLKIFIQSSDLESRGRFGIDNGIQGALQSGYTLYTDQKIYARNSADSQVVGRFDKIVKWMNKVWAFNFLTGNDTRVNMFNITPVLYSLELTNVTNTTVNATIYNFILNTK